MKEKCFNCPVLAKIDLYSRAGKDPDLALQLAQQQGLERYVKEDPQIATMHFGNTGAMLEMGCKAKLLCK